jgi:RimK-like ATP-grasp domain
MITAVGIGTDPTILYFCKTAARLGVDVKFIDLMKVVSGTWQINLSFEHDSWVLEDRTTYHTLNPKDAYYCRLIDLGSVDTKQNVVWRTVINAFTGWLELCPGKVVNRPGHVNDNACKPLHEACLSNLGFIVPPSFTGSSKSALIDFTAGGKTVAKALSGQRADCRIVTVDDFAEYDDLCGPVHLQRFVIGDNVRAHVIGDEVIAVRINSFESDYRLDRAATFEPYVIPADIVDLLRKATRSMGLSFAGWDFKVSNDKYWTLEVNPMPGYSYYDRFLDGKITDSLIKHLQLDRIEGESA